MADEVRMSAEDAARVQDDFNNLSNEFANAQTAIFSMAGSVRSGCGELSGGVEHGAGVLELGWRDLMEVGRKSAGLIAGNTNALYVDLTALDQDLSWSISL